VHWGGTWRGHGDAEGQVVDRFVPLLTLELCRLADDRQQARVGLVCEVRQRRVRLALDVWTPTEEQVVEQAAQPVHVRSLVRVPPAGEMLSEHRAGHHVAVAEGRRIASRRLSASERQWSLVSQGSAGSDPARLPPNSSSRRRAMSISYLWRRLLRSTVRKSAQRSSPSALQRYVVSWPDSLMARS